MFERQTDAPPTYAVTAYLPEGRRLHGVLSWDGEGKAELGPWTNADGEQVPDDPWVLEQVHKLARVLKRDPKPRLSRWRG